MEQADISAFERDVRHPLTAAQAALPARPLISIVMTSFNSECDLERSIRSALLQSWSHLEIVLADDASTDGSIGLALRLSKIDPRLRVLRMDRNAGTYAAKNAGMLAARGDVITFMDSDDISKPDRLLRQLELLRTPGLVATTCNYVRTSQNGEIVLNGGLRERQALISLMIKRQVVDDVGWFDTVRTSADDEFFERIRHVFGRSAHQNVSEPLYVALHREGSLSTSGTGANRLDAASGEGVLSAPRQAYVRAYRGWYAALEAGGQRPWIPRRPSGRPFPAPPEVLGAGG